MQKKKEKSQESWLSSPSVLSFVFVVCMKLNCTTVFYFHGDCLLLICHSNSLWKVNTLLIRLCLAFHSPLTSRAGAINTWPYKMYNFRIM